MLRKDNLSGLENGIIALTTMVYLSKSIKSGKNPDVQGGDMDIYMQAYSHFKHNLQYRSIKRYSDVLPAIEEVYRTIVNYYLSVK